MSSAESIKRAMEACEKGIKTLEARVKTNGELVKAKEDERARWRGEEGAHKNNCNNENNNRQAAQGNWDNNFGRRKRELEAQDHHQHCHVMGPANSGRCDGDFYENRRECCNRDGWGTCWSEKKICRRHGHSADSIARRELGERPPNFQCPPFPKPYPGDAQLDQTPITVGCCANQTNIIGSTLDNSLINQQNNCLSSMQNDYDKKKKEEAKAAAEKAAAEKAAADKAAAEKAAAEKAAADKAAAEKAAAAAAADKAAAEKAAAAAAASKPAALTNSPSGTASGTPAAVTADNSDENKQKYLIVAAIIAAICCCLIMMVVSMMMMK